ncbi:hypothetical protein D5086_021411 [Populus alba]|uniref:Uncharacterized protein n=1 Tax=Populus alba TaxID=43335 RepID=A0ACC4BC33_POPAL
MAAFDSFEDIQPSNHTPFDEVDDESYSNFGSYSTAAAAPDEFSGGGVSVDHVSASPDVFGFGSDADPVTLIRVRSGRYMLRARNGSNGYNGADDGIFVSHCSLEVDQNPIHRWSRPFHVSRCTNPGSSTTILEMMEGLFMPYTIDTSSRNSYANPLGSMPKKTVPVPGSSLDFQDDRDQISFGSWTFPSTFQLLKTVLNEYDTAIYKANSVYMVAEYEIYGDTHGREAAIVLAGVARILT